MKLFWSTTAIFSQKGCKTSFGPFISDIASVAKSAMKFDVSSYFSSKELDHLKKAHWDGWKVLMAVEGS